MSTQPHQLQLIKEPLNFKGQIDFIRNWNNKLNCQLFTTIRLYNTSKYHLNECYKIFLQEQYILNAKIIQLRHVVIDELPEYTCYLDTGYNSTETKELIKKMYATKEINWNTQLLSIILLENLDFDSFLLQPIKK